MVLVVLVETYAVTTTTTTTRRRRRKKKKTSVGTCLVVDRSVLLHHSAAVDN